MPPDAVRLNATEQGVRCVARVTVSDRPETDIPGVLMELHEIRSTAALPRKPFLLMQNTDASAAAVNKRIAKPTNRGTHSRLGPQSLVTAARVRAARGRRTFRMVRSVVRRFPR